MSGLKKKCLGIGFGIFLLILWEVLSLAIGKSYILPGPLLVIEKIIENREEIFCVHLPATMQVVLIGCVLSILLGAAFAMLMDLDKRIEKALYPILTVTQTIPVMCIAPIFVLWFGYSITMRVVVVVLTNFFAVAVNVFDGLKSTSKGRSELMLTYGASKWQRFILLRFPSSLPYFFTALKIVVPWSIVGAAVAEWLGAPNGLGTYSRSCMMNLDAAGLLAPLVVITVLALLINTVLNFIEKRVIAWNGKEA